MPRYRQYQSTAEFCSHVLAVAETMGNREAFLKAFNQKKGKANSIVRANIPGGKKQKKKRREKDRIMFSVSQL